MGALYYLFRYYYLILTAATVSCVWAFIMMHKEKKLIIALKEHREVALIVALFFGNLLLHVIAPLLSPAPFAMYAYFNYYAPLGAVVGGLGIAGIIARIKREYLQGLTVGVVAAAIFFSLFPWYPSPYWPMSLTALRDIDHAAERLAALTSPGDKIFSITLSPEFLLADRRPYSALVVYDGFSSCPDAEKVLRFNRYNYAMADRWLKEADVIILSDMVCEGLASLYKGTPGSGKDVVDLAREVVARDFSMIEEIPRTSRGEWRIYRRKSS